MRAVRGALSGERAQFQGCRDAHASEVESGLGRQEFFEGRPGVAGEFPRQFVRVLLQFV